MSRDDIQKLLGGYATGTLTPDEQRALYEAALTDQELFDALAREEALREVLSDPASRAQLLAAIDDVPEAWYRRWWRPMVVMGTAALLIVALAIYTRPPQGTQLAKVELPKFRPPSAAPAVPLLPPPPELRQAQPKLKELRIPLPPPKAVPPPPLPVIAAAPAPPPVTLDGLAPRFDVGANAPRAQAPAVGARLLPQSTVELSGRVTDASGATVPAAQVEVKSLATGEKVKTSTDAKGDFTAPAASGDKVEISASAPGLQSSTAGLVTPRAGAPAPAPVNLTLAAGSAVEMADVTAATEVLPSGVAAGSGGRGGAGAFGAMRKAAIAPPPPLEYRLLQRSAGRARAEVHANDELPADASLTLRLTSAADGYVRVVENGRTLATPKVSRGIASDIALPQLQKAGRVELQVYFSRQLEDGKTPAAPTLTIAFNIQ